MYVANLAEEEGALLLEIGAPVLVCDGCTEVRFVVVVGHLHVLQLSASYCLMTRIKVR